MAPQSMEVRIVVLYRLTTSGRAIYIIAVQKIRMNFANDVIVKVTRIAEFREYILLEKPPVSKQGYFV